MEQEVKAFDWKMEIARSVNQIFDVGIEWYHLRAEMLRKESENEEISIPGINVSEHHSRHASGIAEGFHRAKKLVMKDLLNKLSKIEGGRLNSL